MRLIQVCGSSSLGMKMICGLYGDQKEIVKEKTTYLEIFDELIFFQRFQINKDTFFILLGQIQDRIRPATNR
jgi:hypothetical protein